MVSRVARRPGRRRSLMYTLVAVVVLGAVLAVTSDYVRAAAKEAVRTTPEQHDSGALASLHPAVRGYVSAVDERDTEALVAVFASDAVVTDTGREFRGHDEIRAWADDEVIGGRLTVLEQTPGADGAARVLLRFDPDGPLLGFRATYTFDVRDDRIHRVSMAYA
ncbi:nuclear transport factor 2 family protein [Streptomyces sp. NPDC088789]|uniref:nuclear transport factor 2 family protein n=1 Tax=Streptomyces sp. NPDC088789 TaxID=3365899 RepID=UPI00382ABCEC